MLKGVFMKKLLLISSTMLVLTACGNESVSEEETVKNETEMTETKEATDESTQEESSEAEFYETEEIIHVHNEKNQNEEYAKVKEELELPYFYENTKLYNGKINPNQKISFKLPSATGGESETVQPTITKEGQFTLPLFNRSLNKENNMQVLIEGEGVQELAFELPIQVEKEGKEIVPENKERKEAIEHGTYLPDFYANTNSYYGKTLASAEVIVIEPSGQQLELTADEDGNFSAEFANFPYVAHGEANLSAGDQLIFIIADEDGYSTYLEKEVLEASDDPNYTEPIFPDE